MSNKRGKYNSKNTDVLQGCSVQEIADYLGLNRSTVYYKLAAVNEIMDAITELKKNKTHEQSESNQPA